MAKKNNTPAVETNDADDATLALLNALEADAGADTDSSTTAPTEAEIASVLSSLEDGDAQAPAQTQAQAPAEAEDQAQVLPFKDLLAAVTADQAKAKAEDLANAFDERAAYEHTADPFNNNIQKTLSKARASHLTPGIVAAFVASNTDANYVNASEVTGKRRNVYALDKLRDFLYAAVTGHLKNAINIACMTSLVKLKDTALPFDGVVAKACASDKVAVKGDYKIHLKRHTVAESTASTQASSTMTALEVLGVVTNQGTRPHPIYVLTDTPLSKRLQEVVTPATA
jgi:hypothetical protein